MTQAGNTPRRSRTLRTTLIAALVSILAVSGTAAVSAQEASPEAPPEAGPAVTLQNAEGDEVGTATFTQEGGAIEISVLVEGLEPGEHGLHIHETGICDPSGDEPFSSAGGHFNPTGASHGAGPAAEATPAATPAGTAESHAGDLGNITVAEDGTGTKTVITDQITLAAGADNSLADDDGSALVVHQGADDLMTDPSGESGPRVACGVVAPPSAGTPAASPAAEGNTVEVSLTNFEIGMPSELPAGPTTFQVTNNGDSVHNFEVEGQGIEAVLEQDLQPGESATLEVDLQAGTYEVYCPVGNHADRGMSLELTVTN